MMHSDLFHHDCRPTLSFNKMLADFFEPEDAPCTQMNWISKIELHRPLSFSYQPPGIFELIDSKNYNNDLWKLVTRAMPPYFGSKYHNINIDKIIKDYPTDNFLSIMTVYSLWHEAFGLPLLSLIHKRHMIYYSEKSKIPPSHGMLHTTWSSECDSINEYLRFTWEGEDTKGWFLEDECAKTGEFLLERCIHMQLPWKPILLHQWLAAALAEILEFERESVELRHLPLSEEIIGVSVSIINMIRQLKERILLGFAILNQQIIQYPASSDPKFPHYILDEVVLPSIPVLEFLCNGDARKIVDFLKKNATQGKKLTYLPIESYTMDSELATLHSNFMYNFNLWSCEIFPTLFPVVNGNIEDLIARINTEKEHKINSEVQIKPMSEEEKILQKLSSKEKSCISLTEQKIIMMIINDKIIKTKKIYGITSEDVKKKLESEFSKKKPREYYLTEDRTDFVEIAVRHGLMYIHAYHMLVNKDHNAEEDASSVASQLISLQISVVEKEQLVRLIHILRLIFNIDLKPSRKTIDMKKYKSSIARVIKKVKNQNRELFWSQFPTEWKKEVEVKELKVPVATTEDLDKFDNEDLHDVPGKLIPALKNRIGRMIYNTAKNSFDVVDKGSTVNPNWTFVQNLLPAMVAALLRDYENKNDEPDCHNLLDYQFYFLMDQILESFEYLYGQWMQGKCKKIELKEEDQSPQTNLSSIQELPYLNLKIHEYARQCIGVELIYSEELRDRITTFDRILNNLHDLGHKLNNEYIPGDFLSPLNAWFLSSYRFTQILFQSALLAFQLPIPGNPIEKHPRLGDLYFVSSVISELEALIDISKIYRGGDKELRLRKSVNATFEGMKQLRYELLLHARDPEVHDDHTEIINKIKPKLLKSYNKMKEFRESFKYDELNSKLAELLPFKNLDLISEKFLTAIEAFEEARFDKLDKLILPVLQRKKTLVAQSKKLPAAKKKKTLQ